MVDPGEPDPLEHEPDPHENEPDEFDPDSLGPDPPDPAGSAADADPETAQLFWSMVVVFNVALMTLSLGVMFVIFRNRWTLGSRLAAVGVILFVYGTYRVRKFQSS